MPSNATGTLYPSTNAKTYVYDSENFQVKRTLVSSSTAAFTTSVSAIPTTSVSRHFSECMDQIWRSRELWRVPGL